MTTTARSTCPAPSQPFFAPLVAVLWSALLLLLAGRAEAAGRLIVVLEPKIEGTLSAEERSRLDEAVKAALQESQFTFAGKEEVEVIIAGENTLKGCYSEECQERIGRLVNAPAVFRYRVKVTRAEGVEPAAATEPPSGKRSKRHGKESAREVEPVPAGASVTSWVMSASLFNVEIGAMGGSASAECPNCAIAQAAQTLNDLVKRVAVEDAARPRGPLEVLSEPTNSSVFVDGHELGITPYRRETFAGKHEITVRRTGYRSKQTTVNVIEGQKASVQIKLEQGADASYLVLERQPRPKWRIALGIIMMAGGGAMIGIGAGALALNGSCVDPLIPPATQCNNIYKTYTLGLPLVAVGALVFAGGILTVAIPGKGVYVQRSSPVPSTEEKKPASDSSAPPQASLGISLGGVGSGLGVSLRGGF